MQQLVRCSARQEEAQTPSNAHLAFYLTGNQSRAGLNAIGELGLRPALLAPYRDLTALRYDFPLVLVDGAAVRSCLLLAVQAEGAKVTTVEGLSLEEGLTPLQASFRKHHALQCGFCTPGMITTAHALLSEEPDCDADRVREVLSGNLCRCTGYISIVEAVLEARAAYKRDGKDA